MRWSAGPGATASPTKPSSREASNPIAQLHNLSDERTVEQWTLNPCFQFFCGEREFQWSAPCAASELVHFRDRIGPAGGEKLLTASIALHGARAKEKEVVLDTTAQEKAITFPTDAKLHAKVIKTARRVAAKDGNALCQSYARTVSKLLQAERGWRHPRTLAITMGAVAILLTLLWVNAPEPGSAGQATGDKGPVTGTGIPGDARWRLAGLFIFPVMVWLVSAPMVSAIESQISLFLLRKVVSVVAFVFVDVLGLPIEQQGNVLALPGGTVGVEDACSGIRSLTASLFAGSFLAAVFLDKLWRKVTLVAVSMVFVFFANLGRSLFLTAWAYSHGPRAIEGAVHDIAGYSVLGLTFGGLAGLVWLFNLKLGPAPEGDLSQVKP